MKKNAVISVVSKQQNDDEDVITVVTPGKYYNRNDKYYAVYEESELSGMEGTTTTLKIEDDMFTLLRSGTVNTKMIFKNKEKNHLLYVTSHGSLGLTMEVKSVHININDMGGDISAKYDLEITPGNVLPTEIKININTEDITAE
ncbi:Uncharacterized beta-barrel protein YwiB, DUF1934 family [Hathewaya proteolytica DSM 3090]|uniref:Uncharacterized beta-barrel protein YwiB, DUF1934 family n=1 Tax=Hathewaya proteolytica DSM 3090 TaxID=1121331 RepID=A0A1M6S840_9CLOT|nr:DUF1934 domain-containing protein [Hathewaya proteolytica]SHK40860.1 Uncharacterized beta-barrel protein YwiB, DUF1934 family [Hathewaya proteolytica DSM 3090]